MPVSDEAKLLAERLRSTIALPAPTSAKPLLIKPPLPKCVDVIRNPSGNEDIFRKKHIYEPDPKFPGHTIMHIETKHVSEVPCGKCDNAVSRLMNQKGNNALDNLFVMYNVSQLNKLNIEDSVKHAQMIRPPLGRLYSSVEDTETDCKVPLSRTVEYLSHIADMLRVQAWNELYKEKDKYVDTLKSKIETDIREYIPDYIITEAQEPVGIPGVPHPFKPKYELVPEAAERARKEEALKRLNAIRRVSQFHCNQCMKVFPSMAAAIEHEDIAHRCPICRLSGFTKTKEIALHLAKAHPVRK